jgi:hypothetical protein
LRQFSGNGCVVGQQCGTERDNADIQAHQAASSKKFFTGLEMDAVILGPCEERRNLIIVFI